MSRQHTILLVEDDEHIMMLNRQTLAEEGYHILEAEDLASARKLLDRQIPDAIVLDIHLPDGNGLDFIPEIRTFTSAPVLLLTALDKKDERIEGLRAGGDDYITKPYDLDELRARIAAFIRRGEMTAEKITCGPLTLDIVAQQAFLSGNDMQLVNKEFSVLLLFIRNRGKTLTKDYVYEKVWGQPLNNDCNALYSLLKRLKKKLEQHDYFEFYVSRNEGYCLNILS